MESNADDKGREADICGFHGSAYRFMAIWAKIDKMKDVEHPRQDFGPAHAA